MKWQPIETAPYDTEIMLTGDSGYIHCSRRFIMNGFREHNRHNGQWLDAQGDILTYYGYYPTHWMPLPDPPTNETSSTQ